MEPERGDSLGIEIGILSEGRDRHPVDRKHGDDDERRKARVDEDVAANLLERHRERPAAHRPGPAILAA